MYHMQTPLHIQHFLRQSTYFPTLHIWNTYNLAMFFKLLYHIPFNCNEQSLAHRIFNILLSHYHLYLPIAIKCSNGRINFSMTTKSGWWQKVCMDVVQLLITIWTKSMLFRAIVIWDYFLNNNITMYHYYYTQFTSKAQKHIIVIYLLTLM